MSVACVRFGEKVDVMDGAGERGASSSTGPENIQFLDISMAKAEHHVGRHCENDLVVGR